MDNFRPMKAPSEGVNPGMVRFPTIASPKIDGIRACVRDGVVLSSTLKPIPNPYVQGLYGHSRFNNLDGELTVGPPTGPDVMRRAMAVMRKSPDPIDVHWHVFDYIHPTDDFMARYGNAYSRVRLTTDVSEDFPIHAVHHIAITNFEDMIHYENRCLMEGYEGVMLRSPDGRYKCGRSTLNEQLLLKLKRFADSEAEVLYYTEQYENTNKATVNELGLAKRQSLKEGMVPKGTLGGIHCRDIHSGVEFDCGTGPMTDEELQREWNIREFRVGSVFTYKHFPIGVLSLPRFPNFKSWRDKSDITGY